MSVGFGTASSRSTVFVAELDRNWLVAAKVAVLGYDPGATFGVTEQDAVPKLFVVAVHV